MESDVGMMEHLHSNWLKKLDKSTKSSGMVGFCTEIKAGVAKCRGEATGADVMTRQLISRKTTVADGRLSGSNRV